MNPKKLIDVKFSHLGRNMTMQRTLKLYKLPEKPQLPGFRKFTKADLNTAFQLVNKVSDLYAQSTVGSVTMYMYFCLVLYLIYKYIHTSSTGIMVAMFFLCHYSNWPAT